MKKRAIAKFGGFENSFNYPITFSDETLEQMRSIIKKDFEKIEIDLKEKLSRLEGYFKNKGYVTPKVEDFVIWFFDKKKISQTGIKFPEISEDELFEMVQKYTNEIEEKWASISEKLKRENELKKDRAIENTPEIEHNKRLKDISQTEKIITKHIGGVDSNKSWEYAFAKKTDYYSFVDLLTCFFEYRPYQIPENIIKLKHGSKTKLAKVLNTIHKELSEKSLKSDTDFFKIIKTLNHFEKLTDAEIYHSITR